MKTHYQLSDTVFKKQFEDCSLAPTLFTHEAHLRLAWIHIRTYGEEKACKLISTQILKFATKNGDPDKFNKTVTIAAIKMVHHFIKKSKSTNFQNFIEEFPRLKNNFKELIGSHYGFDIFNSKSAKEEYLEPDKLPF